MAVQQAAGVAGGSTKHTQNQADPTEVERPEADAPAADSNPLGTLTPDQLARLIAVLEAQQDQEQRANAEFERVMDLNAAHTHPLTAAQLEALARLREPFREEQISMRPQPWCKACSNSPDRACGKPHKKIECKTCGTRITEAHTDLPYVGHAGITDRLLSVDPTWDWEPLSVDEHGHPRLDARGGLWIKLIVCGVVRKGYGDAPGKNATTTAMKEIVGDAIRNAGMRFGMALDLWSKVDLHKESEPPAHPADPFVDGIKQERVWNSPKLLAGVRQEAEEAGQLDHVVGSGGVTLAEVIDERLKTLAEVAEREAQARIEREEQRKAAVTQVATEHGVTTQPQSAPPAQQPPANQGPPAESGPQTADEIRTACGPIWQDAEALEELHRTARDLRFANDPANVNAPQEGTLGQAIRQRINALRRAAAQSRASTGQPDGGAHQYADSTGDWGYGDDAAG